MCATARESAHGKSGFFHLLRKATRQDCRERNVQCPREPGVSHNKMYPDTQGNRGDDHRLNKPSSTDPVPWPIWTSDP